MLLTLFRKFSAPSTIKHSLCSFLLSSCPHKWILGSPLWIGHQTISGWDWFLPFYSGKFSSFQHSLREWNRSLCHGSWHPMMVIGQSPSAHGSLLLWSVWWDCALPDVSCFGNVIHFLLFSHKKKLFFVQLLVLATCWLTYTSCWYWFIAEWLLMSWSSSASHW